MDAGGFLWAEPVQELPRGPMSVSLGPAWPLQLVEPAHLREGSVSVFGEAEPVKELPRGPENMKAWLERFFT